MIQVEAPRIPVSQKDTDYTLITAKVAHLVATRLGINNRYLWEQELIKIQTKVNPVDLMHHDLITKRVIRLAKKDLPLFFENKDDDDEFEHFVLLYMKKFHAELSQHLKNKKPFTLIVSEYEPDEKIRNVFSEMRKKFTSSDIPIKYHVSIWEDSENRYQIQEQTMHLKTDPIALTVDEIISELFGNSTLP